MIVQEKLEFFRARTRKYLELGYDRFAAARFVASYAAQPPESGSILDIGTGKGILAAALADVFGEVVSVDVSPDDRELAAAVAQEAGAGGRIRFLTLDAAHLPFRDGAFDRIASMDVLHHLEEPGPVLTEAVRVLGPSGRLVLADFTPEGFDLVARVHQEDGTVHPVGPVTVDIAAEMLRAMGLRLEHDESAHLQRVIVLRRWT